MYNPNNIFARILRGEIPCKKVYEDAHVLAFEDVQPAAPVHVLVVPKGEYRSFDDFAVTDGEHISAFFASVQKVIQQLGVAETGYRLVTNHGADASQTVHHFHIHILAGRPLGGLVEGRSH